MSMPQHHVKYELEFFGSLDPSNSHGHGAINIFCTTKHKNVPPMTHPLFLRSFSFVCLSFIDRLVYQLLLK